MPHHAHVEISGEIVDVFAHRFVIATAEHRVLADLGPKGAELFALELGARVTAAGEGSSAPPACSSSRHERVRPAFQDIRVVSSRAVTLP